MYIAKVHIGGRYMPGDILPDNMSAETLEWLIRAGAVRVTAPAVLPPETPDSGGEETQKNVTDEPADMENGKGEQSDNGDTDKHDEEGEDEFDDDAEVPEIDVMAGIVQTDAKSAEIPAPNVKGKSRKKKGGKAT